MGVSPIPMGGRAAMSNKTQDPLIRAEAEKKLKQHRELYQQEFKQSIEEIDRNFLLRK